MKADLALSPLEPKSVVANGKSFFPVYLSSLPLAYLSDARRRRLVVTGNSARIQDETTESSAWFFNELGMQHHHMGHRFKVSQERQLVIVRLTSPGMEPTTSNFQVERSTKWAMGAG